MVHIFKALGQAVALDVESGGVYAIDEEAYAALDYLLAHPQAADDEILNHLQKQFDANRVMETLSELREMIEAGYLFSPDETSEVQINTQGIVKAMCIHAAHDCNLRCQYCFADAGEYHSRNRALMPVEVGKKALDWLVQKKRKPV